MSDHDDITQTAMFREAAAEARKERSRHWARQDQGLPEGVMLEDFYAYMPRHS